MTVQNTYSTVLGICGNIAAMALFLSPLPTFVRIVKTKDVGAFTPAPYVLTVLNCCFWIIYGLPIVKNLTLVMSINGAGLAIEFVYVSIYMLYAKGAVKRNTQVFIFCCSVVFSVVTGVTLGVVKHSLRWKVIGSVCVIIGIIQNFAPLLVIRTVIRTKSAEYLPFFLSLFILINGGFWTAYGAWPFDIFIIIPNGFGVLFGIVQLILKFIYRKNAKVTQEMFGKTTTPDEKFALEEGDDPEADYFPDPSPRMQRQPSYSFPPDTIFRLEGIIEEMKAKELERAEAEKERQRSEDARVIEEAKRDRAERTRERQQKEREATERRKRRESKQRGIWTDEP